MRRTPGLLAVVLTVVAWPCLPAVTTAAEGEPTLWGHNDDVVSVAFSRDGKTIASGSAEETIMLWDVATGKEKTTCKGHALYVSSVAFSPDGKTLASGSSDQMIKLWD